jgi:hypothetical protein
MVAVGFSSCLHPQVLWSSEPLVLLAGSLYLIGEFMEHLGLSPALSAGERGLNEWTGRNKIAR